jgi:hypothetical protein
MIGPMGSPAAQSEAANFASLAARFCALVESSETLRLGELVQQTTQLIVALYDAAMRLPHPNPSEQDAPESLTADAWQALYQRLSIQFGDINDYSFIFDPYDMAALPVTGSLADDLADIYRDLKTGLIVDAAEQSDDAIWEWRFGFEKHWGRHAAHALYALHVASNSGTVSWIEHGRPTSFGPTSLR